MAKFNGSIKFVKEMVYLNGYLLVCDLGIYGLTSSVLTLRQLYLKNEK